MKQLFSLILCSMISFAYADFNKEKSYHFSENINAKEHFFNKSTNQMTFHSQASQDLFVFSILYRLLEKKDNGYYLEIGAGNPVTINNTYCFEKNFGWTGVSIDISNIFEKDWTQLRKNPLLIEDATQSDYISILKTFPQVIDYLSLDIDSNYDVVLKKIPFNDHIFKVITIEHDFYRFGNLYREKERDFLHSLGYHLLCSDVKDGGHIFEDWWIHPSAFPPFIFSKLTSLDLSNKEHQQIIQTIKSNWQKGFFRADLPKSE